MNRFKKSTGVRNDRDYPAMINNQINWFKVAVKARDRSLVGVYEYPELAHDPAKALLLYQLNEKVKINPNLQLPSDFVLSKEIETVKEYGVPQADKVRFGESKTAALEVLDDILAGSLAMHLYPEPKVTNVVKYVVKLNTQHFRSQSNMLSEGGHSHSQSNII